MYRLTDITAGVLSTVDITPVAGLCRGSVKACKTRGILRRTCQSDVVQTTVHGNNLDQWTLLALVAHEECDHGEE